jgi:SAM-dependent methyltransferase
MYYILKTQFGFDPRVALRSLQGMPRYIRDFARFRSTYPGRFLVLPCVHDWYEEGGTTKSEYFWQDLLVARMIFANKPDKHVDVGSRVDGFIAHVASFREIEVFDIRPIERQIPGVSFRQADLMSTVESITEYCDSLSCLHALEHFGLGRYGDTIDPMGFERGFANMARLLRKNGTFYLSVPVGVDRVEFNAHRVFDPRVIIDLGAQLSLSLQSLILIHPDGKVETVAHVEAQLLDLARQQYTLGLFVFKRSVK